MSSYTELASIDQEIQILRIIDALKDLIVVALQYGFSKTSYFVQNHVKYIKRIKAAKSPMAYIKATAKKLFPDEAAYNAKIAKVRESYENKKELIYKFESLYELYYNLLKEDPPKRQITENEAIEVLAEMLA